MTTILVIDDEPQIRFTLEQILGRAGYEVITAADGAEAIARVGRTLPDLVITDIIMPEKEGLETIRELKQRHPNLPVIAMSGGGRNTPEDYLSVARLLGAGAVFEKPVEKKQLLEAVRAQLGGTG